MFFVANHIFEGQKVPVFLSVRFLNSLCQVIEQFVELLHSLTHIQTTSLKTRQKNNSQVTKSCLLVPETENEIITIQHLQSCYRP